MLSCKFFVAILNNSLRSILGNLNSLAIFIGHFLALLFLASLGNFDHIWHLLASLGNIFCIWNLGISWQFISHLVAALISGIFWQLWFLGIFWLMAILISWISASLGSLFRIFWQFRFLASFGTFDFWHLMAILISWIFACISWQFRFCILWQFWFLASFRISWQLYIFWHLLTCISWQFRLIFRWHTQLQISTFSPASAQFCNHLCDSRLPINCRERACAFAFHVCVVCLLF